MNLEDFRVKVGNNELCRLCLSEGSEEVGLMDELAKKSFKEATDIIEKFNLVEVS